MNRRHFLVKTSVWIGAVACVGICGVMPVIAQEKSLYERLGGASAIATVVDDFVDRLLKNQVILSNPKTVEAAKSGRFTVPGLKYLLAEQICAATGDPQKYTGREMKESHQHLNISEKEWEAMAADLKATLDKFKVPEKEQQELFAILGKTKKDVVGGKAEKAPELKQGEKKTLYERLGGVHAIAAVSDELIERVSVNDALNANPRIKEARDRVPKAALKFQVTALVCQVTGGPQKYFGRSMKESHAHLNITEKEWQAIGADFKAVLDKFKVPEQEQKELFAIVESTKKDIVTTQ